MEYKIETGIPMPANFRGKPTSNVVITANRLNVGESFVFHRDQASMNSIYVHGKRFGKKFRIATNKDGTARVWRIK